MLAPGGADVEGLLGADGRRHRPIDERIEGVDADAIEHRDKEIRQGNVVPVPPVVTVFQAQPRAAELARMRCVSLFELFEQARQEFERAGAPWIRLAAFADNQRRFAQRSDEGNGAANRKGS
mgnify:CR=1 FL=1